MIKYGDESPWPALPDGNGPSLQRVQVSAYGNDPANWKAGPNHGNPGFVTAPQRPPVVSAGADASGVPASAETNARRDGIAYSYERVRLSRS